jgi:NADH-ubiquinone oxidoreductase chain 5
MYLTLIALPGLGALAAGTLGRKLGTTGAQIVTSGSVLAAAALAVVAFFEVALAGSPVSIELGRWFAADTLDARWALLFDGLTVSMLIAVLVVSGMVHLFSVEYMAGDPHQQRFMSYLSAFTFFMCVLLAADNYALLFLGWEGIGVASYLLVNFWFTRTAANKAGIQALLTNRVGDMLLTLGLLLLIAAVGGLDFPTAFGAAPHLSTPILDALGLLLLGGCLAKSAQVPLHAWLPNAMEGPTPVSALIHAATLVTAGVYLLLRSSPVLEFAPTALLAAALVGATTALFAATTGLLQNDVKRVIAFSTASQLGYMVAAVGLSQHGLALFHLVNHAFFKALLFLAAGGVLHSMADQQDARRLGALAPLLPLTLAAMLVGSLSLMAVPFTTGFFSKDAVLAAAGARLVFPGPFVYGMLTLSAALTAFYSFRLLSLVFLGGPRAPRVDYESTHEQPLLVALPFIVLALAAIFLGFVGKDFAAGFGSDALNALFTRPGNEALLDAELGLSAARKGLPVVLSLCGAGLALVLYRRAPVGLVFLGRAALPLYRFFSGKWLFDVVIQRLVVRPGLDAGLTIGKVLDKGALEVLGPRGLQELLPWTAARLAAVDGGAVTTYALYLAIGALAGAALPGISPALFAVGLWASAVLLLS